jgi:hypothetical protein
MNNGGWQQQQPPQQQGYPQQQQQPGFQQPPAQRGWAADVGGFVDSDLGGYIDQNGRVNPSKCAIVREWSVVLVEGKRRAQAKGLTLGTK